MAEFKFFCPQCGQQIQCDTSYAGQQINCPVCQQVVAVPQPPRAASAVQPPVAVKSRTLRNVLVAVAAVLVLAGLVIGGWYGYSKIRMHQMPPGLVASWSGEDNANDSVGDNNGTLMGSTTFTPGKVGQGFEFDGNNGSGVLLGNPARLQLQDFTIEAWLKRGNDRVISHSAGGGVIFGYGFGGYSLCIVPDGHPALTKIGVDNTMPDTTITDTSFHHLAVTKSGNTVVFYVDGTAYPVPSYTTTFTFTSPVGIGYRPDNQENSFLGTLDEIGFFNRALSAPEIQAIYTAQK
jgi:hypothetical protein